MRSVWRRRMRAPNILKEYLKISFYLLIKIGTRQSTCQTYRLWRTSTSEEGLPSQTLTRSSEPRRRVGPSGNPFPEKKKKKPVMYDSTIRRIL